MEKLTISCANCTEAPLIPDLRPMPARARSPTRRFQPVAAATGHQICLATFDDRCAYEEELVSRGCRLPFSQAFCSHEGLLRN